MATTLFSAFGGGASMTQFLNIAAFIFSALTSIIAVVVGASEVRRVRERTGDDSLLTSILSGDIFQSHASDAAAKIAAPSGAMAGAAAGSPFTSRAEAATAVRTADILALVFLFLIIIGGYHIYTMLSMGDWDIWVDGKDGRFWPTVLPFMLVTFPVAAQYFFWVHLRLPIGATFFCLALLTGEWLDRYVNFWGWTYYPINLDLPTLLIPQALFLDGVLLLSNSFVVSAIVGSMGFSLLLHPTNWVILAQFHQPVEQYGTLMTVADLIRFHYVGTSMPEYIRIVERGTMRTFGDDVVGVAAFFSGFVSIIVYFVWWYVGRMHSTVKYMQKI